MEKQTPPISVRNIFQELRKMVQNGVNVKEQSSEKLRTLLDEDYTGYVLITCAEPSNEGKMQVELSFGGDVTLASYLAESAKGFFETRAGE